jgi:hypothetical protein
MALEPRARLRVLRQTSGALRRNGGGARWFWGVLARRMMRKSAAVQPLTRRDVVKSLFETQIPASIEPLIKHARAPRDLSAVCYATKSEGA